MFRAVATLRPLRSIRRRTGDRRSLFYDSRMRRIISLLFLIVCSSAAAVVPAKPERHVVVVVWDGMRPDFVTEQNTPTLWKLAREGVTFRNHHAVYPSATMVNGTAMVTGVYPGKSGIIANHVYRPDIDPHHAVDVELPPTVKKGDELSGGKYIAVPTIAELVERAGARSVIAAAKTVGLLLDRQFERRDMHLHTTAFAARREAENCCCAQEQRDALRGAMLCRARHLIRSPKSLAHFRLLICKRIPGQPKH